MQESLQLSEAMFVVLLGRVKDHIVEVGYAAAGAPKVICKIQEPARNNQVKLLSKADCCC